MADVWTGDNAVLRMEAWVNWADAPSMLASYHWKLSLIERTASVFGWSNSVGASVEIFWDGGAGYTVPWSGSFAFDFRPGGQQFVVIAEGDIALGNHGNGDARVFTFRGNMAGTGTSTAGGPASVDQGVSAGNLYVTPGTPHSVAAAYVSDTQINVTWAQSSAANGQPTSNDIESSVNGGAFGNFLTMSTTNAASVGAAANQKIIYRVRAYKAGPGVSAWSASSAPVYTTPAAPTSVVAVKDGSDIDLTFIENVAYDEHTHEVWHGTIAGGVTTWDGAALITLASGVTSYTHVAPDPGAVHVYRIRAKAGTLSSAYGTSNSVQLLAPPAKPTVPALASFADKASVFRLPWVHNPIDSSAQTKYQWRWSSNGGGVWTTGAKTTSVNQFHDFAASMWAANAAITFQVRTKGAYDSGADGDASYSPWSDSKLVTFKTIPVATITAPAEAAVLNDATLRVTVGFSQAEAATFVKAELELLEGAVLLETLESAISVGITMATPVQNGGAYTVRARVQDSNGLWSTWDSNNFTVVYLAPVPAVVTTNFLPDTGYGQINLTIAEPAGGQAAASFITITRTINGVTEIVVDNYPAASELSFLDTTATVHGTNTYTVTTLSSLGAQSVTVADLITEECRRAYLSKGLSFDSVAVFGGNLEVDVAASVASNTIQAAGRIKPIGLYGVETSVQMKVSSFVFGGFGSTIPELEALLLMPGKACFRDASGRRIFGSVKGSVSYVKTDRGELNFTLTETS